MEISLIRAGHPSWEKTITFAEKCSWRAGSQLAKKMRDNDFLPWERVIVASEKNQIAGFCTFCQKDELPEEYQYSPFIGFVFVDEKSRGKRLSEKMISAACKYARQLDYKYIYIMSGEIGLYEKYGFEKLGDFKTIYGTRDQLFRKKLV